MLTLVQRLVVELITQALLYGIYLATFIQCFRWFVFTDEGWKLRDKINSPTMAFATIFVFLTSTSSLIMLLYYTLSFFWGDEKWYMDHKVKIDVVMVISWTLELSSIDSVLIYRCWLVYGKSWRVICVPVTFWLGLVVFSALSLWYNRAQMQIWGDAMVFVFNIATTIYTTTAMIYRIRSTTKASGCNPTRLNYIMRILVESGIIFTSTSIFSLVGMLVGESDNATWVTVLVEDISAALSMSMVGISFNLIIIRVCQSRIELRDSMVDTRNIDNSELQVDSQVAVSPEGTSTNPLYGPKNEIQELRSGT